MNFITIKSLFLLKTKLRKQKVWKMKGLTKKEKIKVKLYPKKKKIAIHISDRTCFHNIQLTPINQ